MSKIEEQSKGRKEGEIRYLTPLNIETNNKKKYLMLYCQVIEAAKGTILINARIIKPMYKA